MIVVAEDPPPLAPRAGERPKCSRLVQALAGRGDWVVNRHHESVQLDPLTRFLVRQLDGVTSRRDLAAGMIRAIAQGDLQVAFGEQAVQEMDEAMAATLVEHRLDLLAKHALLVP